MCCFFLFVLLCYCVWTWQEWLKLHPGWLVQMIPLRMFVSPHLKVIGQCIACRVVSHGEKCPLNAACFNVSMSFSQIKLGFYFFWLLNMFNV